MTWTYTDPGASDKDAVRFLVGDTDTDDQLVMDEEVLYSIANQSTLNLAAALCLRALAARYSREASSKVGDVSASNADISRAFSARADELDPNGVTASTAGLVLPSFGGLTISGKEDLDADTDAVQPAFRRNANDIPGGPGNPIIYDPRIR